MLKRKSLLLVLAIVGTYDICIQRMRCGRPKMKWCT